MALKITCPHCGDPHRLGEPYPLPGAEVQCRRCGRVLAITYPTGMVERLRARGTPFLDPHASPPPESDAPPAPRPPLPRAPTAPMPSRHPPPPPRVFQPPPPGDEASPTVVTGPRAAPLDHTRPMDRPAPAALPAEDRTAPLPPRGRSPAPPPAARADMGARPPAKKVPTSPARPQGKAPRKKKKRSLLLRLFMIAVVLTVFGGLVGAAGAAAVIWHYSQDLPTFEALARYEPPTVTVVYDHNGELLGEIFEKRRYVVPLDQIPKHVQDSFIAAEDANFWTHGGVDYEGILRAIARNAAKGKKAQGASTITMQVARNFLLTTDKTYERKIREILLSRRIEATFDKEHILWLYLNQIYLGSGAYGVEAAARTYFGKHVEELTLAESAILAGLPQRPSDYSPIRNWDKARAREEYVLGQLLDKGYIDRPKMEATLAERVAVRDPTDDFMEQAPWFTEHVRRYLVETYGFDKIYNDGLIVHATVDMKLQKVAEQAVVEGVSSADRSVGWRGPLDHLEEAAIAPRLTADEQAMREAESHRTLFVAATEGPDRGGYGPLPERSSLEIARTYEAVVLDVSKSRAIVGIGGRRAVIPISTTLWAYEPNPERSFKYRRQDDLTRVLTRGDLVTVEIGALDVAELKEVDGKGGFEGEPLATARLLQNPELEGALLSYRLSDGAVQAMIGGTDFQESEFNRAIQARRQVGSTFKPIVYSAAIQSKLFSVGSMIQDAPTVFQTIGDKLWKPGNYGGEYLGNITLRRALQMSRNVCTVRVLDKLGLDPVFELAGPTLRIGYDQPTCSRKHIPQEEACDGTLSPSTVAGMAWCERCDPTSCPLIKADRPTVGGIEVGDIHTCLDETQEIDGERWCHSCDVNLRVCSWIPLESMPSTDPCIDARRESSGQVMCRSCDLSMGLGSSSLSMVELLRAYSAFATYGHLVEPHFIDSVVDRDGTVIEQWTPPADGWPQVLDPSVAGIATWLLHEVATGGTGAKSNALGLHLAGKTGTTNDFFDAWFVGFNPDVIAATWVGYDTPRSIGQSFTGGQTALPIWMSYMREAVPKSEDRNFPPIPGVVYANIDESTGRIVSSGGRSIPMLPGTIPNMSEASEAGQKTAEDLLTTGF